MTLRKSLRRPRRLPGVTVQPATFVEVIAAVKNADEKVEETTGVGSKKAEFIESTSAPVNEKRRRSHSLSLNSRRRRKRRLSRLKSLLSIQRLALSEPVQEPTAAFVAAVTKPEPEAEVEEEAETSAKEDSEEVVPGAKAADTEQTEEMPQKQTIK
ncbi:Hypothetical predicted protein [Cloeon dipterum]|uniref:Uncharacterized protein n=1 Tax=Cloeon dipterum TaxID=197152 RepID=A0A8S1E567_9INSE|nr:Hypothetical predicted protein [Cloeon dipterum]